MTRKFKDIPVPSYFQLDGTIYQKTSKTKARVFGNDTERVIRSNPDVVYIGECLNQVVRYAEIKD